VIECQKTILHGDWENVLDINRKLHIIEDSEKNIIGLIKTVKQIKKRSQNLHMEKHITNYQGNIFVSASFTKN
jgi:hypothetical protein